ncbi:phosphotransferase [Arthrobacter sp. R-11]|uniref:phosphotransferase n=1 Tax=Arthrobacter sp. R-11 TaxID=3404053 RepID=UPI003CF3EA55
MDVRTNSEFIKAAAAESGLLVRQAPLGEATVLQLLELLYGLSGTLVHIPTEKDETFRLEDGKETYLVKLSSPQEDPQIVNLQTTCMAYLEHAAPDLPVQRLVRTLGGKPEIQIPEDEGLHNRVLRVMRFVPGRLLADQAPTADQLQVCGATLARLSIALSDFEHPRASRILMWDLKHFHRMRPLLGYVEEGAKRSLAEPIFDQFDEKVVPLLDTLTTQVVHGDFSPFNVLVDPEDPRYVTGIIDFGDVVRTPVIFDISVAMANHLGVDPERPWDDALHLMDGYRSVRPLPAHELEALSAAAPARLLLRALITEWRAIQYPEARDYLFSHSKQDWDRLASIASVPAPEARFTP